jgi:SPX domain protein involved in polyphosphate accumulation
MAEPDNTAETTTRRLLLPNGQHAGFETTLLRQYGFTSDEEVETLRVTCFDNAQWLLYRNAKEKQPSRYMLQLRQRIGGKKCTLQYREWTAERRSQMRLRLKEKRVQDFLTGEDLLPKLLKDETDTDAQEIKANFQAMRTQIMRDGLRPVAAVMSTMRTLRNQAENMEVTVEYDIQFASITGDTWDSVGKAIQFDKAVLEVTTVGKRPQWFKELAKQHQAEKGGFSKFCAALETLYGSQLPKIAEAEDDDE